VEVTILNGGLGTESKVPKVNFANQKDVNMKEIIAGAAAFRFV